MKAACLGHDQTEDERDTGLGSECTAVQRRDDLAGLCRFASKLTASMANDNNSVGSSLQYLKVFRTTTELRYPMLWPNRSRGEAGRSSAPTGTDQSMRGHCNRQTVRSRPEGRRSCRSLPVVFLIGVPRQPNASQAMVTNNWTSY
jgi:hypothetical protein